MYIYNIQILKRDNAYVPGRRSRTASCAGRWRGRGGQGPPLSTTSPDPPPPHPLVPTPSLAGHSWL